MGYSKLIMAARKIESNLEENKSDAVKAKAAMFESDAEES